MKRILIIAGEASSDMHAANLIKDIKSLDKDVDFFGLGGNNMKGAGASILHNIVHLAFIGPGGLFKHYVTLKKIYRSLCKQIDANPPDCAILIDYAEFNLRVARHLKSLDVPIIYYISPQVWAWGLWRIKTIRQLIDKMLVFFRFEEKLYKEHNVDAVFIGHPLLSIVKVTSTKEQIKKELGLYNSNKLIGVVPGSRESEIKNILPIMLKACEIIRSGMGSEKTSFVLPLASTISESCIREISDKTSVNIKIVKGNTYNALSACDCAMVTSGTATLEAALLGIPMTIIYKANFLTYILTKSVIRLPFIGLANIVAGKNIVPEFLQYKAKPEKIAAYMMRLLSEPDLSDSIKKEFSIIKSTLGKPGASIRAAEEVVEFLNQK